MLNREEAEGKICSICGEFTDNLVEHVMYHFDTIIEKCRNCNNDNIFRNFDEYKSHRQFHCLNHSDFNPAVTKVNEKVNCYIKKTSMVVVATTATTASDFVNSLKNTLAEKLSKCNNKLRKYSEHVAVPVEQKSVLPILCNGNDSPSEMVTKEVHDPFKCYSGKRELKFIAEDKLPWSDQDPMSSDSEDSFMSFFRTGLNGCRTSNEKKKPEKPSLYLCDICGKTYRLHQNFRSHWYKHQDFYACNICKERFSCRSKLEVHVQREHIYSTDHICEVCGKTFCHQKFLQQHAKRHENNLMYPCLVCEKRFFDSYALKSHMRQHTNEKPFKCSCGAAFRHNVLLKAHKRSKHGFTEEKTIPCKMCNKLFGSRSAIYAHMRLHNK